jgi:CRISPR-associated endonuclease Cas1 subtype I-E
MLCGSSLATIPGLPQLDRTAYDFTPLRRFCRIHPSWRAGRRELGLTPRSGYRSLAGCMFGVSERCSRLEISTCCGIEGARMKESYKLVAARVGIPWGGRRYDRANPSHGDVPNQAINHAASAIEGAAAIAVACTGAIPQLGFIHEDSGQSFVLDIADLVRVETTIPVAFRAAKEHLAHPDQALERLVRRFAAEAIRRQKLIPAMIQRVKELFELG